MFRLWFLAAWIPLLCLGACGGPEKPSLAGEAGAPAQRASAEAEVRPGLIELRRWREPRQRVVIDRAGVLIGPAGGVQVRKLFVEPERLEDLLSFLRTYAPFRQRSAAGELAFVGQGPVKAGAVEQRMIFEWARKVAAEVESVTSGDSYGLVVAWRRGGGEESCDGLAVYLDGEVRASACAWPDESRGRLRPEALAHLNQWYDELKPFQDASGMEAGRGRVPVRLTFAGRGTREASPQDLAALQALAAALHRDLAVRRGGAVPPPPAAPGSAEAELEEEESVAQVPAGPSLLVPPAPPARLPPPRALPPGAMPPPPADEVEAPVGFRRRVRVEGETGTSARSPRDSE
jgi:hypothetical protein